MITIREVRTQEDVEAIVMLGKANRDECAPDLPYVPDCVIGDVNRVIADTSRVMINYWIAFKDGQPIGYARGTNTNFIYNNELSATLHLIFVLKEFRHTWATVRLIKQFERWARDNNARRMSVGVERLEADQAKHIRALFPKLDYRWAGSFYLKEIN